MEKTVVIAPQDRPRLKLIGRDGNAFAILAAARTAARKAGWTSERVEAMTKEAQSGDYGNLLRVMMAHFDVY